jgi:DNA-binding transcriptional LysR family regulator
MGIMQFEALKVFCDVARFRSFSQAAAANDVTQPAASQIVHQLEKRLGVKLIDRSTRPPQLTPEGERYYEGVRDLVARYLEIESAVRHSSPDLPTTVKVVAIYSVGLRDMNQYIERFGQANGQSNGHGHERVQIEYLHPDRVYEKVLDGTADLGLVSFPKKTRGLVSIPWREEEMVLTCSPSHPLARQRTVKLSRLARVSSFVGFDRGLTIRRQIDRFLKEHGVGLDVAFEFDNIENIKHAVEVSGVTLLPFPTVQREISEGRLAAVHIADARMVRPLAIIHRRSGHLAPPVRRFLDLLQQPDEPVREMSVSRPPAPLAVALKGASR